MTAQNAKYSAPSSVYASDKSRWQAVRTRDTAADGAFYYAVRTTGIYCRPSCAARLAKREHVLFYKSPLAAKSAGFRPCKRCKPDDIAPSLVRTASIAAACRMIEKADAIPALAHLAEAAGMSRFHFHRQFKAVTGLTPRAYAQAHRGARLRGALKHSASVTEAIYEAGFNSSSRFYDKSAQLLGMTPATFRTGGKNMLIRFTVSACSLGKVLVAASEKGVCAIFMGDNQKMLVQELRDRFPHATLIGADPEFETWVAKVVALVEAPQLGLDLPLDIQGTAFQQRVWRALREIEPGTTMNYAGIAEKIGAPKAVRAVAQACAANKLALIIPCHRVIRTDGSLSGYRWGVKRKRSLLEREAKNKRKKS